MNRMLVVVLLVAGCARSVEYTTDSVSDLSGPVVSDWDADTSCIDPCYPDPPDMSPLPLPDLAQQLPDLTVLADLSVLPDMTELPDMTVLPDFTVLADMTVLPDMTILHDFAVPPDMTCVPTPYTPTVELLIDRSGSMATTDCTVMSGTCPAGTTVGKCGSGKNAPSGCVNNLSRWGLVQYALTDSSVGVVNQLQSQVYFGATLFDAANNLCPDLIATGTPALNNAPAIDALFVNNQPSGYTPTALAVSSTATYVAGLPSMGGSKFIVLATDGLPNTCTSSADDTTNTVAAIKAAYDSGIVVYVLGVGPEIGANNANLQAMADAGQGKVGAVFYKGTSPSDLVSAFNTIIANARGCNK